MFEPKRDLAMPTEPNAKGWWKTGFQGWHVCLFACVLLASLLVRFTALESIPGPPYIDEAATAANAICLAEQGTSAFGDRWPMFVEVLVGNWEPPMIAYPTALIAKVGGGSIGTLRLFPALVVVGIALAVFLLGKELADSRTGAFASLLVLLAPWSFVAGRLLWKCPLAPLFVVLGVYFFVRGLRGESASTMALSALAFALALYSYQSSWAQVPLLIAALAVTAVRVRRGFVLKAGLIFGPTLLAACIPLIVLLMSGGLMKRAEDVSVFADGTVIGALRFARNYLMHFSPDFLFWSGDSNLRHGVGSFGQLSWLDVFAVLIGGWTLWMARSWCIFHRSLALIAILGVLTGAVTGAMTNEGIPHALRANGMWPFWALLGAWLLVQSPHPRIVDGSVALISAVFVLVFAYHHMVRYPEMARKYFSPELRALAESETPDRWERIATQATGPVARYYLMHHAQMTCAAAGEFMESIRKPSRSRD